MRELLSVSDRTLCRELLSVSDRTLCRELLFVSDRTLCRELLSVSDRTLCRELLSVSDRTLCRELLFVSDRTLCRELSRLPVLWMSPMERAVEEIHTRISETLGQYCLSTQIILSHMFYYILAELCFTQPVWDR